MTLTEVKGLHLFRLLLKGKATDEQKREYWERHADTTEKRLGKPLWAMDSDEFDEYIILGENLQYGKETGGNCKLCKNRGYVVQKDGEYKRHVVCSCMAQRKNKQMIQSSVYAELIASKTFENFNLTEDWQKERLHSVKFWTNQKKYPFLYLGGATGAGKTHLGIAAFYSLVQRGVRGKYVSWRSESRDLKMRMTEYGFYDEKIRELKRIPLLMLDDFFWTNKCDPTEEDFKLAKEIIEERQAAGLKTIFTANYTIKALNDLSEVVGGRIYEGCGSKTNFALTFDKNCTNYRAKTQPKLTLLDDNELSPFDY